MQRWVNPPLVTKRKAYLLHIHIIGIHDVLPPIVMNSMDAPGCFGKMCEPPHMMLTDIAVAPIASGNFASHAFEVGKVVEPVITFTNDRGWIVPIVMADTVWGKMDISKRGPAGADLVVANEAFP